MTPRDFRALPRLDQIEMMGHLQEADLRKAHADHVDRIVAELKDPKENSKNPPPRGRP